jgi:hypothetical protein
LTIKNFNLPLRKRGFILKVHPEGIKGDLNPSQSPFTKGRSVILII